MTVRSRRQVLGTMAAGAGVLAAGRISRARADDAVIRIGCSGVLSGPQAEAALKYIRGVEIAVDEINQAGGIDGRKVEIVYRDTHGSPTNAVANLTELAGSGIKLFIAGVFSGPALAEIGVIPTIGGVLIGMSALGTALNHENFQPNWFRVSYDAYMSSNAGAMLMAQRMPTIKSWAAIITDNELGHSAWNAFTAGLKTFYPKIALTEPVIAEPILVKAGAPDYKNELGALMTLPAQGLFTSVNGADLITMFQQARAMSMESKYKAVLDTGNETAIAKAMTRNTPDFWSPVPWYYKAYAGNPISEKLNKDYVARTGDNSGSGTCELGYAAVAAYRQAIATTKSTDPAALIAAMPGMTFESASGKITFRKEDHQGIHDVNYVKIGVQQGDPGWGILDHFTVAGAEVIEPPSPGQPFKA